MLDTSRLRLALTLAVLVSTPAMSQGRPAPATPSTDSSQRPAIGADAIAGLRPRSIGPAMTSGRIVSLAVHPTNSSIIYVGSASGGVWKSTNGGASWQSIFDREGSYSIGWVTLDPQNPNIVWVGTGERNSQRSVSYGDGVYKSEDAGRSWKNVGLKASMHIGRILVHPKNSNIVYVAAQGPLWSAGGERGLYKTSDGGKTWEQVLKISDNTGVTDVVMDPRNPDVLVAAAWQRRRHFFTLINGGPESALYRTTDGGKSWTKTTSGLPNDELGRIGLAISPQNPDVIYANVEAANRSSGFFRSADNGVTWQRMSNFSQLSMYYADIYADPHQFDRVYIVDVLFQVTDDGGRNMRALGQRFSHVDNHVIWVDPRNADHYLVGNDGGLYQSWDGGDTWIFFENLPLAQYYDVDTDNAAPFYNVYGGLQDNYSLGMPSRNKSQHGILNSEVFVTNGGDGFVSRVDPEDPNTIYASSQHAGIIRFDKRTRENVGIQPQEEKGGVPLRWNWDAPYIISPHNAKRLYLAAQFLFRSDDRGDSWKKVSPDLTRQVDRNRLEVMGKVWGPDAVAKNASTALYSNISAVAESPKKEGMLWVGTDDGLIQVSEDGGTNWRRASAPPGAPENAYVTRIRASQHDANTAYVTISNHQNGDLAPYAYRTTDGGRSWTSITGDLPTRGGVFAIVDDHVDPQLLFLGTEFAAYVSKNGGKNWLKIPGIPTIKVADLAIQRRENDLIIGTFGHGIYILDDYRALRELQPATVSARATLFPVRDPILFVPTADYGGAGKSFQGEMLFGGDNPTYGAAITYYLSQAPRTLRQRRLDAERAAERAGRPIEYPTAAQLLAEADEEASTVVVTISNEAGTPIRSFSGTSSRGINRVYWDLRFPSHQVPAAAPAGGGGGFGGGAGPYVAPGRYSVSIAQRSGGTVTPLAGPIAFQVLPDPEATYSLADQQARVAFQAQLQTLRKQLTAATDVANATDQKLTQIIRALELTPTAPPALAQRARSLSARAKEIQRAINGDNRLGSRSDPSPVSVSGRIGTINGDLNGTLGKPTGTHLEQFRIASELLGAELMKLRQLVETDLPPLERDVERAGAPYTPGRLPQ